MSSVATIYLGLDVQKDSVTIAVLPARAIAPTRVERLPNDLARLRRFCERLAAEGEVRGQLRGEWAQLAHARSPLAPEDRSVFSEYLGLLEYNLSRRDELDRQIADRALTPAVAGP